MAMESGSHPRLRTEHDRRAMAGEVPFVVGGNPTAAEVERQAEHDARTRVDLSTNPDPGQYADMVIGPDGGLLTHVLADLGQRGWERDNDRDSRLATALAEYVRHMDDLADRWVTGAGDLGRPYPDQAVFVEFCIDMVSTWKRIREITRDNGGK